MKYANYFQLVSDSNASYTDLVKFDNKNAEVLADAGFDILNLVTLDRATDGSSCDVYHFWNTSLHDKIAHVGLYNGKIEFNYTL